jgi:hypothetical protein
MVHKCERCGLKQTKQKTNHETGDSVNCTYSLTLHDSMTARDCIITGSGTDGVAKGVRVPHLSRTAVESTSSQGDRSSVRRITAIQLCG